MTPQRLKECLEIIRWPTSTLAAALRMDAGRVDQWLGGELEIPSNVASWIEALCFTHEASDLMRPALFEGSQPGDGGHKVPEHIPVYSYNLLRTLGNGPVPLRSLFGTDDEGAVFFLVSRGLATREADTLVITAEGASIGTIAGT